MVTRPPHDDELDRLAGLWYDGWQDAHAAIVPEDLARHRTRSSFRRRLEKRWADVRVVGPPGQPLGFCVIKGDELYQLFVARDARGTGVATTLLQDAERRLFDSGVATAWLACAIGNDRAARFYEKQGWARAGTMVDDVDVETGTYPLEVWRFEKPLSVP